MEKLTGCKYNEVSQKEVLKAYKLWLGETLIDSSFKYSWESLRHNNIEDPKNEELKRLYLIANDIKIAKAVGESLSEGQLVLLQNYQTCFPLPKNKLMNYVNQFFTLFRIYYQNIRKDAKNLSSFQKIEQAFRWTLEEKTDLTEKTSKEEIINAYESWFQTSCFEDCASTAFKKLAQASNCNSERTLGINSTLNNIQKYWSILQDKIYIGTELNDLEKQYIIDFWICFGGNNSVDSSRHFFQVFHQYYEELGLNSYHISDSEKIRLAREWHIERMKSRERVKK